MERSDSFLFDNSIKNGQIPINNKQVTIKATKPMKGESLKNIASGAIIKNILMVLLFFDFAVKYCSLLQCGQFMLLSFKASDVFIVSFQVHFLLQLWHVGI
ncbi:hypothetical protein BEP19_05890 [Ammoniphilus oxalaticus]|uniref:Uncharacterized protein n=1 Tax=Ammoniphilus oxalaticus TaxID=66863 RepID=A0A419SIV9_9BACL|nr:hypothetical protein BEP19_05890 [Ammoniphilus oxalaticus]